MGRRRKRRIHARQPDSSQPPDTRSSAAATEAVETSSEGAVVESTGRGNKRSSVGDSVPEREKRRRLENDDEEEGETTEEDEQMTAAAHRIGSDQKELSDKKESDIKESDIKESDIKESDIKESVINGSDINVTGRNVTDQTETDEAETNRAETVLVKSDQGSNEVGSDENVVDGVGGSPTDPGPLRSLQGDSEASILVTCGRNEGRLYLAKLRVVVNERCRSKCIRTGNTWWTPNEFQFVSGRGAAKDWKRTVKHAGQCLKTLLTSGTLALNSSPPRCLCDSCASQGCGQTLEESDEAGRNINESGEDLSNGMLVENVSDIRKKGIKRRRCIKRNIKGSASLPGTKSVEPAPFASRKRRKFLRNAKPEAHSDSTVSLSADGVFQTGSGSKETEDGVAGDICRPVVASVPEVPLVEKRKRGRPKKNPVVVAVPSKAPDVTLREETEEVKVTDEENHNSEQSEALGPKDVTRSPERTQDSPSVRTRSGPETETPDNYSTTAILTPTTGVKARASPIEPETAAAAATTEVVALVNDASNSSVTTHDAQETTHEVQATTTHGAQATTDVAPGTTHDAQATTQDTQATSHDAVSTSRDILSKTRALSDRKVEQESIDDVSTCETTHPIPICLPDTKPSGDKNEHDVYRKQTEDDVIVSGDVKDDVKRGLSPARDDVTETSHPAPNSNEPRRKNAYLNAVIAELKRKKISRETSVTGGASRDQQHHQLTRHPSGQLQQPTTTIHPTTVSSIKSELSSESKSSTSDSLIRDVLYPPSRLSFPSPFSDPSLAFLPSSIVADGKPPCLRPLKHDAPADSKDVALSSDSHRRTDQRTSSSRAHLPMGFDFPNGDAAFWRHLPSMVGESEGKTGNGGGKPMVGGRAGAADMNSPLSISQLASICGLSQSQLASLPFPPPQFSLYPPYLFMGFPLQPLLPEFQSVPPGSLPPSPATTTPGGLHSTAFVQRPPSRPVPSAAASSSSSSATTVPSSQHQQQGPRRRRSHHHHHCKSSSSASGPPKDALIRQPPFEHHRAASVSALRKTESMPTSHSEALLSELNRWFSNAPGLSNPQWTGTSTKSSAPSRSNPPGSSAQERKLWRPAAAIASSAKEYSSAYESAVPSRSSAHASTKELAVTCRSYGDSSLSAHAYRLDSTAPVDFTRRFRARDEGERKYHSNTGSEEYPCDEQGVLDLSKK